MLPSSGALRGMRSLICRALPAASRHFNLDNERCIMASRRRGAHDVCSIGTDHDITNLASWLYQHDVSTVSAQYTHSRIATAKSLRNYFVEILTSGTGKTTGWEARIFGFELRTSCVYSAPSTLSGDENPDARLWLSGCCAEAIGVSKYGSGVNYSGLTAESASGSTPSQLRSSRHFVLRRQ